MYGLFCFRHKGGEFYKQVQADFVLFELNGRFTFSYSSTMGEVSGLGQLDHPHSVVISIQTHHAGKCSGLTQVAVAGWLSQRGTELEGDVEHNQSTQ